LTTLEKILPTPEKVLSGFFPSFSFQQSSKQNRERLTSSKKFFDKLQDNKSKMPPKTKPKQRAG